MDLVEKYFFSKASTLMHKTRSLKKSIIFFEEVIF